MYVPLIDITFAHLEEMCRDPVENRRVVRPYEVDQFTQQILKNQIKKQTLNFKRLFLIIHSI